MNIITSLRDIFDTLGADDELRRRTSVSNTNRSSEGGLGNPTVAPPVSSHLLRLRYRLMPLLSMEEPLATWLQAGYTNDQYSGEQQIYVRKGWRSVVSSIASPAFETLVGNGCEDIDIVDDVTSILMSSKGDIAGLWDLPDTQRLIRSRKFHMSEAASLCAAFNIHSCCQIADIFCVSFLHDLDRISNPDWQPTNGDILYARLKSTGPETALFEIPVPGTLISKFIRITDVGSAGTRVSRSQVAHNCFGFLSIDMLATRMAAVL